MRTLALSRLVWRGSGNDNCSAVRMTKAEITTQLADANERAARTARAK